MQKFIAPVTLALAAIGMTLAGLVTYAHASQAMSPDSGNLLDLARPIFDEIMKGQYVVAAALALIFAVAVAKRYAPGKAGEWLHTDAGGALATLLMAFAGAVVTGLKAQGTDALTMALVFSSLKVAFTAAGGYALIKKLVVEPLRNSAWYQTKAPAWMKGAMQIVFWMFDKRVAQSEVEKDAQDAGNAAVTDKPSTGVDGVLGNPTDVK